MVTGKPKEAAHAADRYEPAAFYMITGDALNAILRVAYRFNDGMKLDPDERRDLAQRIQAQVRANVDGPVD